MSIWLYIALAVAVILLLNVLFVLAHLVQDYRSSRRRDDDV